MFKTQLHDVVFYITNAFVSWWHYIVFPRSVQ